MSCLPKIKEYLSKRLKKKSGSGQGSRVSSLPITITTNSISSSTPGTTIAAQPPTQAAPSIPQPLDSATSVPELSSTHQPTTSNITTPLMHSDTNLWAPAYEMVQQREGELMLDYKKHLDSLQGNTTASRDLPNPQSVESIVNMLLEVRERKKLQVSLLGHDIKIRTQVEKLAKFLVWSDPIVKSAVSTQPYAALAWSGVSLLLPLLTSNNTQNEAMLKGFDSIGDLQVFWKACEDIYLRSPHQQHYHILIDPLTKLYSFIIEYQARIICHLSRAQLSRAWQDVAGSNNWAGTMELINKLNEDCRCLIPVGIQAEIRKDRDNKLQVIQESLIIQEGIYQILKENKQDEKERRLLKHLALEARDYERHKNINPERVPGTCEWFLMDERFRKWRDATYSSILWVSAGPGRGKSVLTRSLIDERRLATTTITIESATITTSSTSTVCYFFFKDGGDGPMNGAQAFCAILHQLFTCPSTSELIQHALPSHKENDKTLTHKFRELWQILVRSANSISGEIICVLDALDECKENDRQEIIQALEKFYSQSDRQSRPSKLKFLITSRPYEAIERLFQKFPVTAAYMRFDGDDKSEDISQEINLVIDARLKSVASYLNANDRLKISKLLKSMKNRTYLWLHLTFNIIKENQSAYSRLSSIEKLLSELPSEISDAYEKILSRSQDDTQTEILLQIVLAAERPLTLDEANNALALALETESFPSSAELNEKLWPSESFSSILQNLCGLFINIHDSKLFFIHQTAREFLIHPKQEGNWKGRLNMSTSHGKMSQVCLQYLLLPDLISINDKSKQSFLSYAALNWHLHFRSQDADTAYKYTRHARDLCRVSEPLARLWRPFLIEQDHKLWNEFWESWPDLTFASYLGLSTVISNIIVNENVNVNTIGGYYQTALHASVCQGYLEVMEILLKPRHEAKITINIIQAAAGNSRNGKEVMALLLDRRGDDITITEDVVKAAAGNSGNGKEVMALLLDQWGDDITITEDVVKAAAGNSGNGKEVMALLLDRREDDITITEDVIKAAAGNSGNGKEVMALLLDRRGDSITITEDIVEAAAGNYGNGKEVMALLLDRRGDSITITEDVIKAAAGHWNGKEVMALLLDRRGDDITITEDVVKAAAENSWNSKETIALLLDQWGDSVTITEDVIKAVAGNWKGKEVMALLLDQRGKDITITEDVFKAAAGNWNGKEVMALLLDRRGDNITITEDVIKAAAENSWNGEEMIALLLDQRGKDITITEDIVKAAAENSGRGKEVMALLLNQRGDDITITEDIVKAAAGNSGNGKEVMALLLDRRGKDITITEDIVKAAAGNSGNGKEVMALLLYRRGDDITITEDVVKAAAGNSGNGKEVIALLLNQRRDNITITEDIVKAAAGNSGNGKEVMALLLYRRGKDITITEDIVKAAAGNSGKGKKVMALLLNRRGKDITITEDIVKAAAGNSGKGKKVMALLLDRRGDSITITEDIIKAAAENSGNGKEVMALLLDRRGDDITITEDIVKAAAGNSGNGKEVMALLLDRRGHEITITEEIIKAASTCGHDEVFDLLSQQNGVISNWDTWRSISKLYNAAKTGDTPCIEQLLHEGINPDMKNIRGETPLWIAATYGHKAVVKILAQRTDVNVNSLSIAGRSPLFWPSSHGNERVVAALLDAGADPHFVDKDGKTAVVMAKQNGHKRVVEMIERAEYNRLV